MAKYLSILLIFISFISVAQVHDVGTWLGVVGDKKISKEWQLSFREEIRLNENLGQFSSVFTQVGVTYRINKRFKSKVAYRFGVKNEFGTNTSKHRFQIDLAYKKKVKPLTFSVRTRLQTGVKNIVNAENLISPTQYLRNKLTVKWDIDKKVEPYFGIEIYSGLNYCSNIVENFRYFNGVNIDLKKKKSIKLGYLYQKEVSTYSSFNEHNVVVSYSFRIG